MAKDDELLEAEGPPKLEIVGKEYGDHGRVKREPVTRLILSFNGREYAIRPEGDVLELSATGGTLVIEPRASNLIRINVKLF